MQDEQRIKKFIPSHDFWNAGQSIAWFNIKILSITEGFTYLSIAKNLE